MARVPVDTKKEKEDFTYFDISVKKAEEGVEFDDLPVGSVSFDSSSLRLEDIHNLELIVAEMNEIPRILFKYRMIMDIQTKVLQQLEDEYAGWYARKWAEVGDDVEVIVAKDGSQFQKKVQRTETAKDKLIMTRFYEEYSAYHQKLREERYKLSLIKSATQAIDNYSYKLHAILNYKQSLEARNI